MWTSSSERHFVGVERSRAAHVGCFETRIDQASRRDERRRTCLFNTPIIYPTEDPNNYVNKRT
jgi:hypothetical protein